MQNVFEASRSAELIEKKMLSGLSVPASQANDKITIMCYPCEESTAREIDTMDGRRSTSKWARKKVLSMYRKEEAKKVK